MTTATNLSSITEQVLTLLENDQTLEQVTKCRGEPINADPNFCPWIGVYRREQEYEPRTLGGNRDGKFTVVIIAQECAYTGAECDDALDLLVKNIVNAIFSDATIRGSVDMTNGVLVSYNYDSLAVPEEEAEHYFQTAFIQLTMEA